MYSVFVCSCPREVVPSPNHTPDWDAHETTLLQGEVAFALIKAIIGRLRDVETEVLQSACKVLSACPKLVGEAEFERHIAVLPSIDHQLYDSVNKVCAPTHTTTPWAS